MPGRAIISACRSLDFRAGLLDNAGYLKLLNKTINQVMQTPGRLVQSVASKLLA